MIKLIYVINEEEEKNYKMMKASKLNVDVQEELYDPTVGELKAMKFIKDSAGLNKVNIVNDCSNKFNKEQVDRIDKLVKSILSL